MAWFSRKTRSRLPADLARRLELLGRFEFDVRGSGVDSGEIFPTCIQPFLEFAEQDLNGFVAELRAGVAGDGTGFATYGAYCLVVELAGTDVRTPDALALLDAAIEVKRARHLPQTMLKGYELFRWNEVHGFGTWPGGAAQPPV
ncbi:hypothetical protein AB0F15_36590 [Amycolatopsis sp. NPDC026612]|uniref:hypothetical protein n=1 Tax=Amycolatopsis sp. NPDC026612 TaxID=3155466 RepID=UPI0033E02668